MINPTTHAISYVSIPAPKTAPYGITAGPDGNLWFTDGAAEAIGVINPSTHAISEFSLPAGSMPIPMRSQRARMGISGSRGRSGPAMTRPLG